eukprot:COSAG02_NODE_5921_length_3939_cov_3.266667_3_plen_115_part_00
MPRIPATRTQQAFGGSVDPTAVQHPTTVQITGSQQLEIIFTWTARQASGFGVAVLAGASNLICYNYNIDCAAALSRGLVNTKGGSTMPLQRSPSRFMWPVTSQSSRCSTALGRH